jgi:ABC-2 type transport system ATP-binding protein
MLSTHLLSEVEQVCTHVGVMHVGKLVAQSSLTELRAQSAPRIRVQADNPTDAAAGLRRLAATDVVIEGDSVTAQLGSSDPADVLAALVRSEVRVRAFGLVPVNLEDVFVTLTGEGFGVSG